MQTKLSKLKKVRFRFRILKILNSICRVTVEVTVTVAVSNGIGNAVTFLGK